MPDRPDTWPVCDVCKEPVDAPRNGVLSINRRAAAARAKGMHAWEAEHEPPAGQRFHLMDASEYLSYPEDILWCWSHDACVPTDGEYQIPAHRIDTSAKALEWTIHLIEDKDWLIATNWPDTIRRFKLNDGSA